MITLEHDELVFRFPEVHPADMLRIDFQRTCRIPDDGKEYPLPAGLGRFPLRHVDDFASQLDAETRKRAGVMLPMHGSEAMWINFSDRDELAYPIALKVAAGKVNAVTGKPWTPELQDDPQDYLVVPPQPWLDGFAVAEGVIRQFVAERLGEGYSVEEQLTGKGEFGGLQLIAYPMKQEAYRRLVWEPEFERQQAAVAYLLEEAKRAFDDLSRRATQGLQDLASARREAEKLREMARQGDLGAMAALSAVSDRVQSLIIEIERPRYSSRAHSRDDGARYCMEALSLEPVPSAPCAMGMAAGGRMRQQLHEDPYGIECWDQTISSRCFVTLLDAASWQRITGDAPPPEGLTARKYNEGGLPWFDVYDPEIAALPGSTTLEKVKGLAGLKAAKGHSLDDNVVREPDF